MKCNFYFLIILSLLVCFGNGAFAYSIYSFAPSQYNANQTTMNANLGLTNAYSIENFGSSSIMSYVHNTSSYSNSIVNGTYSWDTNGSLQFALNNVSDSLVVNYSIGASAIGFGMGGVGITGQTFQINGQGTLYNYTTMSGYTLDHSNRNIYIRIEAQSGDAAITSIVFRNTGGTETDYLSHMAFSNSSVPEPYSIFFFGLAGVFMLVYRFVNNKK